MQNKYRLRDVVRLKQLNLAIYWAGIIFSAARILPKSGLTLTDPFHDGEFVASNFGALGEFEVPFVIHGGVDWIFSNLSIRINGTTSYFLTTMFFVKIASLFACIFFLTLSRKLLTDPKIQLALMPILGMLAPILLGYRDLILVFTLLVFSFFVNRLKEHCRISVAECAFLGILLLIGFQYFYFRGGLAIIALGAGLLICQRYRELVWVLGFFFVGSLALFPISDRFQFSYIYMELTRLADTSSYWSVKDGTLGRGMLFGIIGVNLLGAISLLFLGNLAKNRRHAYSVWVAGGVLLFGMLKMGTYRPDIAHLPMALWIPFIIVLVTFSNYASFSITIQRVHFVLVAFLLLPVCLVLLKGLIPNYFLILLFVGIVASLASDLKLTKSSSLNWMQLNGLIKGFISALLVFLIALSINYGNFDYLTHLKRPPLNRDVVPEEISWAANQLESSQSVCTFDFTNAGLISGLVQKPLCISLTYPVYGMPKDESQMLNELRKSNPISVVASYGYWSFSIDGYSMPIRFPKIQQFLEDEYPIENCFKDICVRTRDIF